VKNWVFDDLFHKKCPVMIRPSGSQCFLRNRVVKAFEANELAEVSKAWKITTDEVREFNNLGTKVTFFDVLEKIF
jgi:hypothetical protein